MICALVFATVTHSHSRPPAWLDKELAGYLLVDDEKHPTICVYDKRSGFFLERSGECDGAILWVTLTRDRNIPVREGYSVPNFKVIDGSQNKLTIRPLPSLSTSKGVKIGDSPADVRNRLGKPTYAKRTGSRNQFLSFEYQWSQGKGDLDDSYTETYTFKAGRLIEVHFLKENSAG